MAGRSLDPPDARAGLRGDVMLVFGEVHTGLVQHSLPLPAAACARLLELLPGEQVQSATRPIAYTASPDLLTGVDCGLPTRSEARIRGVGTVAYRAAVTGGSLVQGAAVARVAPAEARRRLPWAHYLSRPGRIEAIGRWSPEDLAEGFTARRASSSLLDLGAISAGVLDLVQASPLLDRSPPFRAARTRMRWVARPIDDLADAGSVAFRVETDQLRTVQIRCAEDQLAAVPAFCEDLARHDWLLTTLVTLLERSPLGGGGRARSTVRLRPAVDHLLHLWMPAARMDGGLDHLWEALERRPGFSRQWQVSVDRIRDHLAVCTVQLLEARTAAVPACPS